MLASQIHYYLAEKVLNVNPNSNISYVDAENVGHWFVDKIFKIGNRYEWNTMIENATGEPLTAKYFVRQFVVD